MKKNQYFLLVCAILMMGLVTPFINEKNWPTVFGSLSFPIKVEATAFLIISLATVVLIVFFDLLNETKKTILTTFVTTASAFTLLTHIFFVGVVIGIIITLFMYVFTLMIKSNFDKKVEEGIKKLEDYVKNNFPNFTRWLVKTDNFLEKIM